MTETLLLDRRTQGMVEGYVPDGELLSSLVRFFSIFSDGTRLRILSALAISQMCVTDISRVLGINQTTVSHHFLRTEKRDRERRAVEGGGVSRLLSEKFCCVFLEKCGNIVYNGYRESLR